MLPTYVVAQNNIEIQALNCFGHELLDSTQYQKASEVFSRAVKLHDGKSPDLEYAKSLAGLAKSLSPFKVEIADSLYTESLNIHRALHSDKSIAYAQTLQDISELRIRMQRFDGVENLLKEVLGLKKHFFGKKSIEYAETLSWLGLYYAYNSDFVNSEKFFCDAMATSAKAGHKSDYKFAEILLMTSYLHYFREDYMTAKNYCEGAVEIFKKKNDPYDRKLMESYACLAITYSALARTDEATELLEDLLRSAETKYGKEDYFYISVLPSLGAMYVHNGRMDEAIINLEESMNLSKIMYGEHNDSYYTALNSLATVYIKRDNYQQAESLFIRSLELRKEAGGEYSPPYITALNNLANLYHSMGDGRRAIKYLKRVAELSNVVLGEASDSHIMALTNLAFIHIGNGSIDETLELYDKIIAILDKSDLAGQPRFMRVYALKLLTYPAEYLSIPEIEELYTTITENIKTCFGEYDPVYINLINHLSDCYYYINDYPKAQKYALQILRILEQQGRTLTETYSITLMNLGKISLALGRIEEGEEYLERYLSVMRKLSQQNFAFMSTNEREIYWNNIKRSNNYITDATGFLISNGYDHPSLPSLIGLSYNSVLFTKSLMLNSSTATRRSILESHDPELIELWQQLISLKGHSDSNTEEVEKLDKQLSMRSLAFERQQKDFSIVWQDVRDNLAPNKVAIELIPVMINDDSSMFSYAGLVLRSDSEHPEMVILAEEDAIIEVTKKWHNGGDKLYPLLFAPLEKYLDGVEGIYVSTSGSLNSVSFAGMKTPDGYLCDRYNIVNLLSTKDLVNIKSQDNVSEPKSIALFGGADFGLSAADLNKPDTTSLSSTLRGLIDEFDNTRGQGFDYLPNSKREVESIGKILSEQGWQTTVYIDRDATETHLKSLSSQSPAVLHISTHGYYFPLPNQDTPSEIVASDRQNKFELSDNPLMRSGLLLSGANSVWKGGQVTAEEDGILTAYEIADLDLSNVRLAVLSACNTGVGHVDYAEGVYGLQRALRLSGVKSMIVALWPIPDRETVELMECFYREWGQSGNLKRAFTAAQLEMRTRYPTNPEVWAAFILIE